MKRIVLLLALSGATLFAAPGGCSSQIMDVMALLCPDCYQHYLQTQGT